MQGLKTDAGVLFEMFYFSRVLIFSMRKTNKIAFLLTHVHVSFLAHVGPCPEGWISGPECLGSCYSIGQTSVNISTAKAACASMYHNARLVRC